MRMPMHVVRTSVKPRLTEGGGDVVEHGCGDQLPEGTAARLAAGDGIGDLLANKAVQDDFRQTLVIVVGASAIAVVVGGGGIAAAVAASAGAIIADAASIIVDAASSVVDGSSVSAIGNGPTAEGVAVGLGGRCNVSSGSGGESGSMRAWGGR